MDRAAHKMPSTPENGHVLLAYLSPAVGLGVVTGTLGACLGGAVGILRSAHPGIAAVYTGAQCFVLGSTALYTRGVLIAAKGRGRTRRDEVVASTCAGLLSGVVAGRFWGRFSAVAGGAIFGASGYFSQRSLHRSQDMEPVERDTRSLAQWLADSGWSPIKSLSNDEYEGMLNEKLARVETELSLVNEKLQKLRQVSAPGKSETLKHKE